MHSPNFAQLDLPSPTANPASARCEMHPSPRNQYSAQKILNFGLFPSVSHTF